MMNIKLDETNQAIVKFEAKGHIGIITIDNGVQNKIRNADFLDLDFFKEWVFQNEFKGLIITGKGRHFSAGADVDNIKANLQNLNYLEESLKKGKEILNFIESLPLITVAAISGVCFGAGFEIALSCHFRIGTENMVLAFPEANIGIMPGLAGTYRLPGKIGRSRAIEIIVSGRTIPAEEAYNLGIIDKIAPNKECLQTAMDFINEMVQNKTNEQIQNIIQSINNAFTLSAEEAMNYEGKKFVGLAKNLLGG